MGNVPDTNTQTGTAITPKPHERFIRSLNLRAEREGATLGRDVSLSQIDKILAAETAEDIWEADEGGTISGQDAIDMEIEIMSFTVAPSAEEYDATLGVFINIKARKMEDDEEIVINTGADKIIAKLAAFESKGLLPVEGVIRGVKTRNGTMLTLRPLPRRATPGTTS